MVFKDKTCKIFDTTSTKLLSVKMKGKSFLANMQTEFSYSSVADWGQIWHKRLGHFHYSTFNLMHKNELVHNLPCVEARDEICGICQLAKYSRKPFPQNKACKMEMVLQLIHAYVCEPIKIESLNGNKYYILFIDDHNRFCWVYFMRKKNMK